MYNEETKKRFIAEFSTSVSRQQSASTMFNTLEPYEREWGADFCTRTKEEIAPVVEEIAGGRTGSKLRFFILRAYIKWCVANNIEGAREDIFLLTDIGLPKLKRHMVANPQHLQRYLDYVCHPLSDETNGCIFRCYYWLAYSGIGEEDAFLVKSSDVDLVNLVVTFRGMEYPIYEEAKLAFKQCKELNRFKIYRSNIPNGFYKDRVDSDLLLRGTECVLSPNTMKTEAVRKTKNPYAATIGRQDENLELQLSYSRLWLSGVFYRTYKLESIGITPNFMGLAKRQMEGRTYKLDIGRNLPISKAKKIARVYLYDYENWKKVFSL